VLILEDRPTDAELMANELKRAGFQPEWERIETCEEFLGRLGKPYDVILADYSLPQFDGLTALRLAKERDLDIPFILISGTLGDEMAVAAIKEGAADYLLKDRLARLAPSVATALEQKRLLDERRQMEQRLRDSERRFRALIENSSDGIVLLDIDRKVVYASPGLTRILGHSTDHVLGRSLRELVHPQDRERTSRALAETIRTLRSSARSECRVKHNSGSWRWIECVSTNMLDDPSVQAIVVNFRDITERRQAEEERREAEADIRRRVVQQEALNRIIAAATEVDSSLPSVLRVALDQTLQALALASGAIWVLPTATHGPLTELRGVSDDAGLVMSILARMHDISLTETSVVEDWAVSNHPFGAAVVNMGVGASIVVPLMSNGQRIGGVAVATNQARKWTEDEVALVEAIGQQLGMTLERARLFEEAKRRADQLGMLYYSGLALGRTRDPRTQIELVITTAMRALHAERGRFYRYDQAANQIRFELGCGHAEQAEEVLKGLCFPLDSESSIAARVARSRIPTNVPDVTRNPRWVVADPAVRSGIWVPVEFEDELRGVLCILSERANAFNARDEQLLALFANQMAVAMENAQLYQQATERAEQLSTLNEMGQALAATLDLSTVYRTACQYVRRIVECPHFGISFFSPQKQVITPAFLVSNHVELDTTNIAPIEYNPQVSVGRSKAICARQPVVVSDLSYRSHNGSLRHFFQDDPEPLAGIYVPMVVGGNAIGLLEIQSYQKNAYRQADVCLLGTAASQIGLAIQNARLFAELQNSLAATTRLYELSRRMLGVNTLEETARLITQTIRDSFHADSVSFRLINSEGEQEYYHGSGFASRVYEECLPLPDGPAMRAWRSGEPVIVHGDEGVHPRMQKEGVQSAIAIPLRGKVENLGVLMLDYREAREFGGEELEALSLLSNQAAMTLERVSLQEETRRRLVELEAVNRISTSLREAQRLDEMLPLLLNETLAVMNATAGCIALYDPSQRDWHEPVACGWMAEQGRAASLMGAIGTGVLASGQVELWDETSDGHSDKKTDASTMPEGWHGVCAPICTADEVIGVIFIAVQSPRQITTSDTYLLATITQIAGNAIHRTRLHEKTERYAIDLTAAYKATIEGWSRALDLRDKETEGHTQRVMGLTLRLANAMGVPAEQLTHIRYGALLHDIGKLGVPDSVLLKPGSLTDSEWVKMRQHPVFAIELLSPIAYLGQAIDIPHYHHEKWDGSGYPCGLKGEDIPLAARIFAIVDVWDALRSDRPYRPAWGEERARAHIQEQSGKHFDPRVVKAFFELLDR
jgi:PAS domain S-box-containing protein